MEMKMNQMQLYICRWKTRARMSGMVC